MIKECTCKICGNKFMGGPRAWHCHSCRAERAKEVKRKLIQNGAARPIGSTDLCSVCGEKYIVNSGMQKYCSVCAKPAIMANDRKQGLEYYGENKEIINPTRNEKRHKPPKICVVCGKEFKTHTKAVACSDECKKIHQKEYTKKT